MESAHCAAHVRRVAVARFDNNFDLRRRPSHHEQRRRQQRRQQQWRRLQQQVAIGGRGDAVARRPAGGTCERRREALLQLQVARRAGQLQGPFQVRERDADRRGAGRRRGGRAVRVRLVRQDRGDAELGRQGTGVRHGHAAHVPAARPVGRRGTVRRHRVGVQEGVHVLLPRRPVQRRAVVRHRRHARPARDRRGPAAVVPATRPSALTRRTSKFTDVPKFYPSYSVFVCEV